MGDISKGVANTLKPAKIYKKCKRHIGTEHFWTKPELLYEEKLYEHWTVFRGSFPVDYQIVKENNGSGKALFFFIKKHETVTEREFKEGISPAIQAQSQMW